MSRGWVRLAASFAVALASLSACSKKKPLTTPARLTFVAPVDGQTLSLGDDVDAALDGIQIDVRVATKNLPAASLVTLSIGDNQLQTSVVDNQAVFPATSIPFGIQALVATAGAARAQISVTATNAGADCSFVAPSDGDALTSADDSDPATEGFQIDVVVQCNGILATTPVEVGIVGRRQQQVTLDDNGRATLANFALAEGPNTLQITSPALPAAVQATVTVNTGRCEISISPDDGAVILFDANQDAPPFGSATPTRSVVVTTTCAAGSSVTLGIDGGVFDAAAATCADPAPTVSLSAAAVDAGNGTATATFAAPLFQGAVTLSASAMQATTGAPVSGAALPNLLSVDTLAPHFGPISPATGEGASLTDSDPLTPGLQTMLAGQVIGVEAGVLVSIEVTDANGDNIYTAPVVLKDSTDCFNPITAIGTFSVPVTLADGEVDLVYSVSDAAGNPATARSASIFVSAEQPVLSITSPAYSSGPPEIIPVLAGDPVSAGGSDASSAVGLQVDFSIDTGGVDLTGQPGQLLIPGQQSWAFVYSGKTQVVRATLSDGPVPNGEIDGVVASATLQSGRVVQSPPIKIRVASTPPTLVISSPRSGSAFTSAGPQVVTLIAQTSSLLCATGVVRVKNGSTPLDSKPITAGAPKTVTLTAALVTGQNALTVEVADCPAEPANTASAALNLFVTNGAATVAWTQMNGIAPSLGALTLPATDADNSLANGYDVSAIAHIVSAPGTAAVTVTTAFSVFTNYVQIPASGTLDAAIAFTLPSGDVENPTVQVTQTINPTALPPTVLTASDNSVAVSVPPAPEANPPLVAITAPLDLSGTNATSLNVTLIGANIANATSCPVTLDAEQTPVGVSTPATLTANAASALVDISTLADGVHSLLAVCDLGGGVTATSQRQRFNLRRSTVTTLAFIDGSGVSLASALNPYVNAQAANQVSGNTFVHDLLVSSNLPDGTTLTLNVTPNESDATCSDAVLSTPYSATLIGGQATFFNVVLDGLSATPNGDAADIVLSATDSFSQQSIGSARCASIDRTPPSISTTCSSAITIGNPNDQAGTSSIEWQQTYTLSADTVGTLSVDVQAQQSNVVSTPAATPPTTNVAMAFPVGTPAAAYAATVTAIAHDAANNIATSICTPNIDPLAASVSFTTANHFFDDANQTTMLNLFDDVSASAGLQVDFFVSAQQVSSGATVHLCSTSSAAAVTSQPSCDFAGGHLIASGTVSAAGAQLVATLAAVSLADGTYDLAAEIEDAASGSHGVSPSFPVIVDSVAPPAVTAVTLPANVAGNDNASTIALGLCVTGGSVTAGCPAGTGAEGTVIGSGASATFTSDISFAWPASSVSLISAALTSAQGINLTAAPSASGVTFHLAALPQGPQNLSITVTSADGNQTLTAKNLLIDLVPPSLVLSPPTSVPFLCGAATCNGGVSVSAGALASDDRNLGGGCVCLAVGGNCLGATCTGVTLPVGTSSFVSPALALPEGSSNVGGEVTDSAGNVTRVTGTIFDVDTLATKPAPSLVAANCTGAGTIASPCVLAAQTITNGRFPLPGFTLTAGNWHQAAGSACDVSADQVTPSECALSGSLLALRPGIDTNFRTVFASSFALTSANAEPAGATVESLSGQTPALDLASEWEIVLDVVDQRGNHSRSTPIYAQLPAGTTGATLTMEKGYDAGAPSQVTTPITDNTAFGVRNARSTTPYTTDIRVQVDWLGAPVAGCVSLQYNGVSIGTPQATTATASQFVTFGSVQLSPSAPSGFVLQADFDSGSCGSVALVASQQANNVTFATNLPQVTFDATWLATNAFATSGTTPTKAPSFAQAQDKNTAVAGFQFAPGNTPAVDVQNAAGGSVTFSNDQAATPLGGALVVSIPTSGSAPVSASALLQIPTVPDAANPGHAKQQLLIATVCNTAGDCVSTTSGALGTATSAPMIVDVDAPAAEQAVVCLGASTVPAGVSGAAAAEYKDDPSCATACAGGRACSRSQGEAVVELPGAPGNDGASDGPVASYQVIVAIRDVDAPSVSECQAFLQALTPAQLTALNWPGVTLTTAGGSGVAAPGASQYFQLKNLPLHQRYCVAVLGTDFAGNLASVAATTPTLRVLPWLPLASSSPLAFTRSSGPSDRSDDSLQPALASDSEIDSLALLGDMDGDGAPEIAVAHLAATGVDGGGDLFSSRRTRVGHCTPRRILRGPTGSGAFMGFAVVGGDFNGDGAADIAIGAPFANADTSNGSVASGLVYVWYGAGTPSGSGEPDVIQTSACTLSQQPQPACPSTIFYGEADGQDIGISLAAGAIDHAGGGPVALVIGAPGANAGKGALYLAQGGSAAFPSGAVAPANSMLVDVQVASRPAYLTQITQPCAASDSTQSMGETVGVGDFDGDGIGDVFANGIAFDGVAACPGSTEAAAYHFIKGAAGLFGAGASFDLKSAGAGHATCVPTGSDQSGPLKNIGSINTTSGAGSRPEWAVFSQGSGGAVDFVQGTSGFFAANTCPAVSPLLVTTTEIATRTAFGPLIDDSCNTAVGLPAHKTQPLVNADSGAQGALQPAAAFTDLTGDGRPDFLIGAAGDSTHRSRVYIVSYSAPACGGADRMRIVGELTGGTDASGSLGLSVISIGNHLGTSPAFAASGHGASGNFGLWFFQ